MHVKWEVEEKRREERNKKAGIGDEIAIEVESEVELETQVGKNAARPHRQ